jgi:Tol biopolymer transport system component
LRTNLLLTIALALPLGAQTAPPIVAPEPTIFAPGIVSGPANDGSPTFTPDGRTLYFTRSGTNAGFILESHLTNGAWSAPTVAPFSGQWNDQHPTMAPDGSYLIFVSTRPAPQIPDKVAHLWRVNRTPTGWSTPEHLPPAVNIGSRIFAPSVASDGTIYFLSIREGSDHPAFQLYRSRRVDNAYAQAEPLPFSDSSTADVDPEIAPDQSFLVFASANRRAGDTKEHLYMVVNKGGTWGHVIPLRYTGDDANGGSTDNEPNLAADHRTLYFSSDRTLFPHLPRTRAQGEADLARIEQWDNGNTNVWSFSLTPFLEPPAR